MKFKLLLSLFIIILNLQFAVAAIVSGIITDETGNPLPFASVFVKNSTTGVSANYEGKYFLELKAGTYILKYSSIGYKEQEKQIQISNNQHIKINIMLEIDISAIDEVEIIADKIDRAKQIMKKVRDKRKDYINSVNNYKCEIYSKSSFEKEYKTKDTIKDKNSEIKSINEYYKKDKLNLVEYVAEIYYKKPNKYKENILAFHDFSEKKPPGRSITVSVNIDNGDITPERQSYKNPYIFDVENLSDAFNFYKNTIDLPQLCSQPIKSPISPGSNLTYKYEYVESFFENNTKIYKLNIKPVNNFDALFKGSIFIEDSTFALIAVDLSVNEKALLMHKNFRIIENYKRIERNIYLPSKLNIVYTIKHGKKNILGETSIKYQNYLVNTEIDAKLFSNEVKTYFDDAFDKDSAYWMKNRLFTLKPTESDFITKTDSIKKYYESNTFLDKQDSIFNRLYWYTPLAGWGRKNHYKGYEFLIGGIFEQIVPFGVGGYRHKLPLYVNKEFDNGMLLETKEMIDYGFKNKDVKGKFGIGLTYFPKKFVRTYINIGNTYELINNYASIEQTFSRSNYANTKSVEIKQRIEIFNGLYAELSLLYSNQNPITDLQLSKWSDWLFRDLNEPVEFEPYIKSEIGLKLKYRINQKYIIKANKKLIIGKDYPELTFEYKRGLPDIFGSEVNFEYFEIGAGAEHQLARFGSSRWKATAGLFTNKTNLRLPEYKYFRGSDLYFFSDPLKSFQLLGKTMNTNNSFIQANYIHHFNGTILNKIPLIKNLKISLAGGAGVLSIPEQDFYHFEMFAGIEKIIRIKKELFRLGLYAVTADNTLSSPNITFKIGISPFNSYTRKWSY